MNSFDVGVHEGMEKVSGLQRLNRIVTSLERPGRRLLREQGVEALVKADKAGLLKRPGLESAYQRALQKYKRRVRHRVGAHPA
jgi:hypothetical protein